MTYTCFICDLTVEAPEEAGDCSRATWNPYRGAAHSWMNNDEKLYYISICGSGKERKHVSGYSYGTNAGEAWTNFCYLEGRDPKDKRRYDSITKITNLQQVIWRLKPENNIAYA